MEFNLVFIEIAAALTTAGVVSLLAFRLRQPLIIAYIIAGLIVGPAFLGLTNSSEFFATMSQMGIAFLLFLVGLGLNWRNVREVGGVSLLIGVGQVVFTTIIGYFIAKLLGFDSVTSWFVAFAFAFSSTIIIVKLLSDKEDLDRLYGRISVGLLIVQDLIAMVSLLVLAAWRNGGDLISVLEVSALKMLAVILALWFISRFFLSPLIRFAARSHEMLFLTAISWCFALSSALVLLGFTVEIGALLAGVTLASSGFEREITSKIRPLRDFFIVIFFIVLGSTLSLASLLDVLVPALIFSAFILFGNPFIVLLLMRAVGFHPRTGFLVGTTVAQISEFSFIVLFAAASSGIVSSDVLPLATTVALITIAASSYLIIWNGQIYERCGWLFRWLEKGTEQKRHTIQTPEVLLLGYHRLGEQVLPVIQSLRQSYLVVDFDPSAIQELSAAQVPVMYGDAGDSELLTDLRADRAKLIVSTIPDADVSAEILEYIYTRSSRAAVVVTVKTAEQAAKMYALGATFVIVPSILSGKLFADLLKKKKTKKTSWGSLAREQRQILGLPLK